MATAPDVGLEQDSVFIGEDDLWDANERRETDEDSLRCLSQRDSVVTTACIGELLGFFSSQNYRTSSSDKRVAEQVGRGLHAYVSCFVACSAKQPSLSVACVRASVNLYLYGPVAVCACGIIVQGCG